MPERTCSTEGCDSPCLARGWCSKHYYAWRKSTCPACLVDGCEKPGTSAGMCGMHYARQRRHGTPLYVPPSCPAFAPQQRKPCEQCGAMMGKTSRCAVKQWARKRYCSKQCKVDSRKVDDGRTNRERWEDRHTDRGVYWERQRQREDKADLKDWEQRQARRQYRVARATRPLRPARLFIGSTCRACGTTWVQHAARDDSDLCSACTKSKWRMNHRQRAKHYGVPYEPIDHFEVFAADGYRCQLCKRKTQGKHPNPRSATLDHIVPLSRGGPHLRHNVQTACLDCNVRKHNGAANDQLRLQLAA